jgi:glycosyltransferase involved in cell wall biosynthesis
MFHEVAVPWGLLVQWKQNVVAAVTRAMARLLLARADRVLVSIPGWVPLLQSLAPEWRGDATWMPIPSNVPMGAPQSAVAAVRPDLSIPTDAVVIGHFGTFGSLVSPLLKQTLIPLLSRDRRRVALAIGHWSDLFANAIRSEISGSGRVFGTGSLVSGEAIAAHLLACDVLIQPFSDGITSRRTSAMAGLALGRPIATNGGLLTEPVWRESGGVELARSVEELPSATEHLLRDPAYAAAVGARGGLLYAREFSLERTLRELRRMGRETSQLEATRTTN